MRQRVIEREPDEPARDRGCGAGHLERSVIGQACIVGVVFAEVIAGDLNKVISGMLAGNACCALVLPAAGCPPRSTRIGASWPGVWPVNSSSRTSVSKTRVSHASEPTGSVTGC